MIFGKNLARGIRGNAGVSVTLFLRHGLTEADIAMPLRSEYELLADDWTYPQLVDKKISG